MCRRHAELGSSCSSSSSSNNSPKPPCLVPLWQEKEEPLQGIVIVVDVLCANPHCLYRDEHTWFTRALGRGVNRPCGSSACLTHNRCSLVVLPKPTAADLAADTTHPGVSAAAIRRRYVLQDPSVH